jgi:hypothetical protein
MKISNYQRQSTSIYHVPVKSKVKSLAATKKLTDTVSLIHFEFRYIKEEERYYKKFISKFSRKVQKKIIIFDAPIRQCNGVSTH